MQNSKTCHCRNNKEVLKHALAYSEKDDSQKVWGRAWKVSVKWKEIERKDICEVHEESNKIAIIKQTSTSVNEIKTEKKGPINNWAGKWIKKDVSTSTEASIFVPGSIRQPAD